MTISVSPGNAGLTVGQLQSFSATTSDPAGVTWSVAPTGGTFSSTTSASGVTVTFTAPSAAGVYTVKATSVSNPAQSSSATVGVTDLAGVYTWHDDLARDGADTQEYTLTTSNVNTTSFGKLFSCTVDGAIYAQPLWMAHVAINGAMHNVVFAATEHDGLFAFDGDASPCVTLWQANLIDGSHGGYAGETPVPDTTGNYLVGASYADTSPEVGVTGTPVIDPTAGILYVVSKSVVCSANPCSTKSENSFYQRLHAIDIQSGQEKQGSPVVIQASYPGAGASDTFSAQQENQRAGLALVNGTVYIAWASHEDEAPFYGWIMGYTYNGSGFTQSAVFNVAPNTGEGGIWMSGAAPAADSNNDLYLVTSNAQFDVTDASAQYHNDYGDSFLKLSTGLQVEQYFTPSDQAQDNTSDNDFGAGGAAVLADLPAGSPVQHLVIGGGKDGGLYILNRDSLGGYGDSQAWQMLSAGTEDPSSWNGGVIFSTGAFWNGHYYLAAQSQPLTDYVLNTLTAKFSMGATSTSPSGGYAYPGSSPSVSASGSSNGIVWTLDSSQYCFGKGATCGPAILHAYSAANVATELWNSSIVAADAAGYGVKFTVPTVANGKVYVPTRGNNIGNADTSTTVPGELDVYGLKPN
ncbi:MAG: hypothetical protein ACREUT_11385 [Steroidobacteraceae bacterium]